jgi:segregation and condensation protein A
MTVDVSTAVYEGPFDLLLQLIVNDTVDLYEINLAQIVDAYLREIERLQALDLDVATEFLLIAATLVELKTRRLLPGRDDIDIDDELALWEERDLLLARLFECKTFKDAAHALAALAGVAALSYPRYSGPEEQFAGLTVDPLEGLDPRRLRAAFLRATTPKPVVSVDLHHVTPIKLTVAEACEEIADELRREGRLGFARLCGALVERVEIIIRFLAVLELYKQGIVELDQFDRLGDIEITWIGSTDDALEGRQLVDAYEG